MKTRWCAVIIIFLITTLIEAPPGFSTNSETIFEQTYKVCEGDNLYKIATSFGTTTAILKKANNLKDDGIIIDQVLTIPAPQTQSAAETAPVPQATIAAATTTEKTEAIQPAVVIAEEKTAEEPLKEELPRQEEQVKTYAVREGDILNRIARSFNLDVRELKTANKLKNDIIIPGQILVIPSAEETTVVAETTSPTVSAKVPAASATAQPEPAKVAVVTNTSVSTPMSAPLPDMDNLPLRDRLVEAGFNMLGVRYRYGGTSEKTGLDCSALVKNLFAKIDFTLPRSSREQYKEGEKVAREDLQKGDLVFFAASTNGKTPNHVGLYIGDGQFLHAARKAKKVIISDLNKSWYKLRYVGARRIMGLWWEDLSMPIDSEQPESIVSTIPESAATSASVKN